MRRYKCAAVVFQDIVNTYDSRFRAIDLIKRPNNPLGWGLRM